MWCALHALELLPVDAALCCSFDTKEWTQMMIYVMTMFCDGGDEIMQGAIGLSLTEDQNNTSR